jgi:acetyl esterase/lipase
MKKRWKFLLFLLLASVGSLSGLAYFLVANDAPIITGDVLRNIEYKPGLKLDVYTPTRQVYEKTPVVIYIHGGAWIAGFKEGLNFNRFNQAANDLRESGYAIVSISYTLAQSNQSPFPACIEDAVDAVIWVYTHAPDHNFDINNVGLFGESAGAHLAMMVAYGHPTLYLRDYPQVRFNYVVDIYGPNRLKNIYHAPAIDTLYAALGKLPDRFQSHLDLAKYIFGFDPKQDTARATQIMETYSPYNYVTPAAPPTLLIQGDSDRVVPLEQSITLRAKLDSLGVENEMHIIEGADHAFAKATAEQKSELQKWIVGFVQRHYSKEVKP